MQHSNAESSSDDPPEGDDVSRCISRVGEGLTSLSTLLPELRLAKGLQSLCLHGNQLSRLDGLHLVAQLTELNLSSNNLATLQGSLSTLTNLRRVLAWIHCGKQGLGDQKLPPITNC